MNSRSPITTMAQHISTVPMQSGCCRHIMVAAMHHILEKEKQHFRSNDKCIVTFRIWWNTLACQLFELKHTKAGSSLRFYSNSNYFEIWELTSKKKSPSGFWWFTPTSFLSKKWKPTSSQRSTHWRCQTITLLAPHISPRQWWNNHQSHASCRFFFFSFPTLFISYNHSETSQSLPLC